MAKSKGDAQGRRGRASGTGRSRQSGGGSRQQRSDSGRGDRSRGAKDKGRRRDLQGAAANLPNWVVEALVRVTPDQKVPAALQALGEASEAFADGKYQRAVRKAQRAKDLAPRDATIREILGLAAYRLGDWALALAELRTFRRLAGETTHVPVEMDSLRAMGRDRDVTTAWEMLKERGAKPAVLKEGKVVYASFLADRERLDDAWNLLEPVRRTQNPFPEDLRMWYVAARVAALRGDGERAGQLRNAILENDPGFPGIDELERLIAAT